MARNASSPTTRIVRPKSLTLRLMPRRSASACGRAWSRRISPANGSCWNCSSTASSSPTKRWRSVTSSPSDRGVSATRFVYCEQTINLITHAMTTAATVHEARCTEAIHAALAGKDLLPGEHLVDAAYVDAELLVGSREGLGIDLFGPPRPNPAWQGKVEGGYTLDRFEIDWDKWQVRCPQGKSSSGWGRRVDQAGVPYVSVWFRETDCAACPAPSLCTRIG